MNFCSNWEKDNSFIIAKEVCSKVYHGFGLVFLYDIKDYVSKIESILKNNMVDDLSLFFVDNILNSFATTMVNELVVAFLDYLTNEFNQWLASNIEYSKSNDSYLMFAKMKSEDYSFLNSNLEIKRIKDIKLEHSLDAFLEFVLRFKKDYESISSMLGHKFIVDNVCAGAGDTHNHGRTVYKLETKEKDVFFYKPHNLFNDYIFKKVQEWFYKNGASLPFFFPNTLFMEDYGWQKAIEHLECKDELQVENFMRRTGYNIFLSYLLVMSDLHAENIIASGEYPCIIDFETIFTNQSGFNGIYDSLTGFVKEACDSVMATHLLPQGNTPFMPNNNVDLCGLSSFKKNNMISVFSYEANNQKKFDPKKEKVNIDDIKKFMNVAILNGEKKYYFDYTETIVLGFEELYSIFLKNKESFLKLLDELDLDKGKYRHVLRNTMLYGKFLGISHKKDYILEKEKRELVFAQLRGKKEVSKEQALLIELEKKQLREEDVPYFYAKYDDKGIYCLNGDKVDNFFTRTIKTVFLNRMNKMCDIDKYKQSYFIRIALLEYESSISKFKYYNIFSKKSTSSLKEDLEKMIFDIISYREKYHKTYGNYCSIILGATNEQIGAEPAILYDGLGSLLFYMEANQNEIASMLFDRYVKENMVLNPKNKISIGFMNGRFSYAYTLYRVFKKYKNNQIFDLFIKTIEEMNQRIDIFTEDIDIFSGFSGVVLGLFNILKETDHKSVKEMFITLSNMLYEMAIKNISNLNLAGFGHGLAGIGAALIASSKYLSNQEYYDLGISLFAKDNELLLKNPKIYSWCNGIAGELIAREIAKDLCDKKDIKIIYYDFDNMLKDLLDSFNEIHQDILCHGHAGSLSFLIWYAKKENDVNLKKKIDSIMLKMVERLYSNGIGIANKSAVLDVSFMCGLTGFGYMLLQYINDEVPSILALEV